MCTEVGMTKQGKLKCHDGSEVNAMATITSVNGSLKSQKSSREAITIFRTLCSPNYVEGKSCTPYSRSQ